ncbi:hypothetical protein OCV67_11860 [Porcipelethomonas ammoniilytica]|nr:hypothetical protein [Porcipelethomonas ammoniilytica]MCU6720615.1 hypothetical protein [Porcipelethomonas ammoniilytica]SCJ19078.1 Uncharacterised protein [uncultured Ruminococcus sp.]
MISTLILLYALDTGQIPTGCYIAAWFLAIIRTVARLIKTVADIADYKD